MEHPVLAGLISGYGWLILGVVIWGVGAAYIHLRQKLHRIQLEREEAPKPQAPQVHPREDKPKVVVQEQPIIRRPQPTEEELRKRREQSMKDRQNKQPAVN